MCPINFWAPTTHSKWHLLWCICVLCGVVYQISCDARCTVVTSSDLVSVWPELPGWIPWRFSYLLGFAWVATVGVPSDRFLTSLIRFNFCACRLKMESVRVLFDTTRSFFCTTEFVRLSRKSTICYPILVSVALLSWLLKYPPLVSFWMSRCLLKAAVQCSFHYCHVCWFSVVRRYSRQSDTSIPHYRACLVPVVTIVC